MRIEKPFLMLFIMICLSVLAVIYGFPPMALLIALIVLMTLWGSKVVHNNYFSPVGIMSLFWLIPSLSTYVLANYEGDKWLLGYSTWFIVVIGSFMAFYMGYLVHIFIWNGKLKLLCIDYDKEISGWGKSAFKYIIISLFTLGMVGFGINLVRLIRYGGLSMYLTQGFREAELVFGASTWMNYLYFLNILVVAMALLYLIRYEKSVIIAICMFISYLALFFHAIKSTIIFPTAIAAWVIIISSKRLRLNYVIIPVLIGFLAFQIVTIGRNYVIYSMQGLDKAMMSMMSKPLYYIAPNYANLQKQVENQNEFSLGRSIYGPIYGLFSFILSPGERESAKALYMSEYSLGIQSGGGNSLLVDPAFNMSTYLGSFYSDMGMGGIFFYPFILGIIATYFYINYIRQNTIKNLLLYSVVATMITFSFWNNEFTRIQFWYLMAVIYLVDLIVRHIFRDANRNTI